MYEFILSHLMWFWVCVIVLSLVIEAITFSLTTVWSAIAAFVMVFLSFTKMPFRWQILIFFLLTILLVAFTRPFAIKKLNLGKFKTNVNSLVGQEVLVLSDITEFQKGEVKTKNGVVWTATAKSNILKDTVCVISAVNGNTLEVAVK